MIIAKCPGCGKRLSIQDKLAGQAGACPACGQRFHVPVVQPSKGAPLGGAAQGASVLAAVDAPRRLSVTLSKPDRPEAGSPTTPLTGPEAACLSDPAPNGGAAPVRLIDMKLSAIVAALALCFTFALAVSAMGDLTDNPWLTRATTVLAVVAYIVGTWYATLPKEPPVTPEDKDPLRARLYRSVQRVCQRAGVPVPRTMVYPSEELNALTFGLTPRTARIAVTEGLLKRVGSDGELDAVLAHEVSHIRNLDCAVAQVFHFALRVVQWFYGILRFLLSLGWALRGLVGLAAETFSMFGFVGAVAGLAVLFGFAYVMFYLATAVGVAFVMAIVAFLAVNAFSRQRERLADDYAAQLVGREPMALALATLADTDSQARTLVARSLGKQLAEGEHLPRETVLDAVRGNPPRLGLGGWFQQLWCDHPLILTRIHRTLVGGNTRGLGDALVSPVARLIEKGARWRRSDRCLPVLPPSHRETQAMAAGALLALVSVVVVSLAPPMTLAVASLAVGIPTGVTLGAAVGWVLRQNGPFRGLDVLDATLTAGGTWLVVALGCAAALALPNDVAHLEASWVVLLVGLCVAAVLYMFVPPRAYTGDTENHSSVKKVSATDPEVHDALNAGRRIA